MDKSEQTQAEEEENFDSMLEAAKKASLTALKDYVRKTQKAINIFEMEVNVAYRENICGNPNSVLSLFLIKMKVSPTLFCNGIFEMWKSLKLISISTERFKKEMNELRTSLDEKYTVAISHLDELCKLFKEMHLNKDVTEAQVKEFRKNVKEEFLNDSNSLLSYLSQIPITKIVTWLGKQFIRKREREVNNDLESLEKRQRCIMNPSKETFFDNANNEQAVETTFTSSNNEMKKDFLSLELINLIGSFMKFEEALGFRRVNKFFFSAFHSVMESSKHWVINVSFKMTDMTSYEPNFYLKSIPHLFLKIMYDSTLNDNEKVQIRQIYTKQYCAFCKSKQFKSSQAVSKRKNKACIDAFISLVQLHPQLITKHSVISIIEKQCFPPHNKNELFNLFETNNFFSNVNCIITPSLTYHKYLCNNKLPPIFTLQLVAEHIDIEKQVFSEIHVLENSRNEMLVLTLFDVIYHYIIKKSSDKTMKDVEDKKTYLQTEIYNNVITKGKRIVFRVMYEFFCNDELEYVHQFHQMVMEGMFEELE